MNETTIAANKAHDASPWSAAEADERLRTSGLALPSAGEKAPAAAAQGLLKSAVQGAHHTLDRLADGAAPAVQKLDASLASAEGALHARTERLRERSDQWLASVRGQVRNRPLTAVAAALALGALIARLTR